MNIINFYLDRNLMGNFGGNQSKLSEDIKDKYLRYNNTLA